MEKISTIDVGHVKSLLQRMKGFAAETKRRSPQQLQHEITLNVPVESLLLSGLHVMENLYTPRSDTQESLNDTSGLVSGIAAQVTAQFICAILETYSPSNPSWESDVATELNTLVSSLQSRQSGATSNVLTEEVRHDETPCTGCEDCIKYEPQTEAPYTPPEGGASLDEENQIETECTEIKRENEPFSNRHCYGITKNIPPAVIFCMRGVRCQLCYEGFKGVNCVKDLIEHTKLHHRAKASRKFLRQLRENNTPSKIVGNGMLYCTCETCSYMGPGSIRNWAGMK